MAKPSRSLLQARSDLCDKTADVDRLKGELGQLEEQNADLGRQLLSQGRTINDLTSGKSIAANRADKAEAENDRLRDRLHSLELEHARVEGILARVREFDPVTEQQSLRTGIGGIDRWAVPETLRSRNNLDTFGVAGQDQPWYRRG